MEMSLILKQPIEDVTPVVFEWNNEELLASVRTALAPYEATDYATLATAAIKHDRALLNRFIKALNDERIRIGRVYTAPLERFKSEVDAVLAAVREVKDRMDSEVGKREAERKQEKRKEIVAYFIEATEEFPQMSFDKIEHEEWLNASYKMEDIKSEIDGIVREARTMYLAIDAMELDEVGKQIVKNLYCRYLDLSLALEEYEIAVQSVPKKEEPTPVSEDETVYEIAFRVTATKGQFAAIKKFLTDNKIHYEKA